MYEHRLSARPVSILVSAECCAHRARPLRLRGESRSANLPAFAVVAVSPRDAAVFLLVFGNRSVQSSWSFFWVFPLVVFIRSAMTGCPQAVGSGKRQNRLPGGPRSARVL